jgi:hypothetical protein
VPASGARIRRVTSRRMPAKRINQYTIERTYPGTITNL